MNRLICATVYLSCSSFTIPIQALAQTDACRLTGGSVTVAPLYAFGQISQGFETGAWVTTSGNISGPSQVQQQPAGQWVHSYKSLDGIGFTLRIGPSSKPDGTQISTVECADPGWCVQGACAPFKQIFWTGIGRFSNITGDPVFPGCEVKGGNNGTLHAVRVMVGDFGDNDNSTRENALDDADPDTCGWFSKLQGAGYPGPPGPYTAADAVYLDSVPDEQFGDMLGQVCDKCPDYYQIEVHCGPEFDSYVIWDYQGYVTHGNYQILETTDSSQCNVP